METTIAERKVYLFFTFSKNELDLNVIAGVCFSATDYEHFNLRDW